MVVDIKTYEENIITNASTISQPVYGRRYPDDYSSLQDNIKDIVDQLYYSEIRRIKSLLEEFLIGEIAPLSFVKSIYTKYNDDALKFIIFIFTETTTLEERRKIYYPFANFQLKFMNTVFDYFIINLTGRNINDFIDDEFSEIVL